MHFYINSYYVFSCTLYIWCISIAVYMMYFYISAHMMCFFICAYDVFLFKYIWCISITVNVMYFSISRCDIFLYMIGNGGQRALSGRGGHWTSIEASGFSRQHCFHTITSLTEDIDILVCVEYFLLSLYVDFFQLFRKIFSFGIPFTQSFLSSLQDFIGSCQILLWTGCQVKKWLIIYICIIYSLYF